MPRSSPSGSLLHRPAGAVEALDLLLLLLGGHGTEEGGQADGLDRHLLDEARLGGGWDPLELRVLVEGHRLEGGID